MEKRIIVNAITYTCGYETIVKAIMNYKNTYGKPPSRVELHQENITELNEEYARDYSQATGMQNVRADLILIADVPIFVNNALKTTQIALGEDCPPPPWMAEENDDFVKAAIQRE